MMTALDLLRAEFVALVDLHKGVKKGTVKKGNPEYQEVRHPTTGRVSYKKRPKEWANRHASAVDHDNNEARMQRLQDAHDRLPAHQQDHELRSRIVDAKYAHHDAADVLRHPDASHRDAWQTAGEANRAADDVTHLLGKHRERHGPVLSDREGPRPAPTKAQHKIAAKGGSRDVDTIAKAGLYAAHENADGNATITHTPSGAQVTVVPRKQARAAVRHFHKHAGDAGKDWAMGGRITATTDGMDRIGDAHARWAERASTRSPH